MWDIIIISSLVLLAIFLIIVEIVLLPGTTIAGIGAFLSVFYAVYLTYREYGLFNAALLLLLATLLSVLTLYLTIRRGSVSKISLSVNNDSIVPQIKDVVAIGDLGRTTSRLAPMGSAMFGGKIVEVKSLGGFIDPNTEVKIIGMEDNYAIVERNS